MSDNATITASSPVKVAETAVSSATSSIRAEAEKAAAVVRAESSNLVIRFAPLVTVVKTDVAKASTFVGNIKAAALSYGPTFLVGWVLGFVAGHSVRR